MTNRLSVLFACLMMLPTLGCSNGPQADYGKLGLLEVSGTVTLDGENIAGAAVYMINEADATYSFGVTDASGKYKMMLNSEKSGVLPGEKLVEISTVRNPLGEAAGGEDEDPDAKPSKTEKIPACYNSKSSLKIEVTSQNRTFNFDLKSDCSTTSAS